MYLCTKKNKLQFFYRVVYILYFRQVDLWRNAVFGCGRLKLVMCSVHENLSDVPATMP